MNPLGNRGGLGQELLGGLEARVEGAWRRGIPSGDTSVPSCLKHQFLGDFPGEPLSPEVAVARRLLVDWLPQVQFSAQTSGRGQFLARAAPPPSPPPRGHTQISPSQFAGSATQVHSSSTNVPSGSQLRRQLWLNMGQQLRATQSPLPGGLSPRLHPEVCSLPACNSSARGRDVGRAQAGQLNLQCYIACPKSPRPYSGI